MTTALASLGFALLLLGLAAIAVRLEEALALLREDAQLVGQAVLVSTTGSTAVRGVVHADLPDRLTLREAVVLTVGSDAEVPAAGLLHIPRGRIDIVQELAAGEEKGR